MSLNIFFIHNIEESKFGFQSPYWLSNNRYLDDAKISVQQILGKMREEKGNELYKEIISSGKFNQISSLLNQVSITFTI